MTRARGSVLAVAVVLLVIAISVLTTRSGTDVVVEELQVEVAAGPSSSETITLDAALYLPTDGASDEAVPAVLLAHGFLGERSSTDGFARELAEDGYAVLAWSARGFGASGGEVSLADPDREIADVSALIDLLAEREEILQDAPGDPRVAIVGASYGGGTALLAASRDARLDAVIASAAWHRLSTSLAPNGISDADAGPLATGWTSLLFTASSLLPEILEQVEPDQQVEPDPAEQGDSGPTPDPEEGPLAVGTDPCGRFAADVCALYNEAATIGTLTPDAAALLDRASLTGRLDAVVAPTLLLQGQQDTLFDLAESRRNAEAIAAAGTPVRLRWLPGGHEIVGTLPASDVARTEINDWLERWLRDVDPAATTAETVTTADQDSAEPVVPFTWTDEAANLPRDRDELPGTGEDQVSLTISADGRLVDGGDPAATEGARTISSPPGGQPAALSTLPGAGGLAGFLPSTDIPGQHVAFVSEPTAGPLTLLGPPRLRLQVATDGGEARVFVKLHAVAPGGSATLIQQSVTPVRATQVPGTFDVTLPDLAYRLPPDHRLRLTVATTDQAFANLVEPTQVTLSLDEQTTLQLPTVATPAGGGVGLLGAFAAVALATAVVLGGVLVVRRRRPSGPAAVTLGDAPPIVIRGLTKRYADGHLAVDGLDLTVEAGQVVGLLGPNGAGKTSTVRMLLGLSAPDEGTVEVFGHAMRPGHPVLHHVGALIEGPGFSPELSGLANLRLYWRAGGRPMSEADLPWALDIAELGDAIHKPVRTYSHGMKQRLAIAQALLGHPALLVLDEPTDGLDPEQIRAMRQLLARMGDDGVTVLVSSHLLAEVEQMCTHVVVVQNGRLRADGPVADLVGMTTTVVVETDDRGLARSVLLEHLPASDIEVSGAGLAVTLGDHDAADVVAWLVAAGRRVNAVTPRGTLEDAFLSLTGKDA